MLSLIKNLIELNSHLLGKIQADRLYTEAEALMNAEEYEKAFPLMKESADLGEKHAPVHVAMMLLKGQGVSPDWQAAVAYLEMARERGSGKVHVIMGTMYGIGGYGLKRDLAKAEAHFTQGIQVEEDPDGTRMLAMLKKRQGVFGAKEIPKPKIPWI